MEHIKQMKAILNKMYGEHLDIRDRLFRVILTLGLIASVVAIAINFLLELPFVVVAPVVFISIVMLICIVLIVKFHQTKASAILMLFGIIPILFPMVFIYGGNTNSGAPIWMVLGLVYTHLFFSEKGQWPFLLFANLSYSSLYLACYLNPDTMERLTQHMDKATTYIDSLLGVLIVGNIVGIILQFQNKVYSKEQKRTEGQRDEIERINRSKSAFFANMSHEIRTPINTIIGLNEMILREEGISDETAENAIHVQNASKMLLSLINDILDLSKIESGKMEIVPAQYETGTMFSELVNIIWIKAHEKQLEFKIDIAQNLPSMLYGDEVRLKQVLINILTNAVKYTEKGSVTLTAKSERIEQNMVRLRISVEDTGIGIKKESMEDLFSSFKRVDQVKNSKIEGTGLGLSIAKQLVDLMGGTITVDSIYMKGSVFTVTVDQQIVSAKPIGSMNMLMQGKAGNRKHYRQRFEAPEARVLVVDDNEMNRIVSSKLLRDTKVQVDTAASGEECLAKTLTKFYHVIFMDHVMPCMDGEETMQRVKKQDNGHCHDTPIIALTANVMSDAEHYYQQMGFDDYLAKPIHASLFEAMLLKYLPADLVENEQKSKEHEERNGIQLVLGQRKRKIGITTDCLSDLPQEWLEHFGIANMYVYVETSQGRFCDTREITADNLLTYMKESNEAVKSRTASVEEYETFFSNALNENEKVIHIPISSKSSKSYESALAAAASFDNVVVFDSEQISSGTGLMVLYAAKMVEDGYSVEEICDRLKTMTDQVRTSFVLGDVNSLYQNHRISRRVWKICQTLQLHPVLHMSQGKLKVKYFCSGSLKKSYKYYINQQMRKKKKIDPGLLFITYAGCSTKQLEEIKREVERHMKFDNVKFQKASASTSCNCGIGSFGLLYVMKKR